MEHVKRLLNVPFDRLLSAHLKRIDADPLVTPFPSGRPFDLLSNRVRQKYETLVRRGLARYRDADREYWSHSGFVRAGRDLAVLYPTGGRNSASVSRPVASHRRNHAGSPRSGAGRAVEEVAPAP